MTREIKFRAWDKRHSKMWGWDYMLNSEDHRYWFKSQPIWKGAEANIERFELMQFTGLLDKSGKEIYEGDLVKHNWFDHMGGLLNVGHQVFEVKEYSNFVCVKEIGEDLPRTRYSKIYISPNSRHRLDEIEIIGNIYENPELLAEEK